MPHGEEPVRVLFVDDEPGCAEMATTFLERADNRLVASAETDPTNVLGRLDAGEFHCVVSDYAMPGVDGLELLAAVRDNYPDLPFVLFTAKGNEGVASEAISAGVTDYVRKEAGTDQYADLAADVVDLVQRRDERAPTTPGDAGHPVSPP